MRADERVMRAARRLRREMTEPEVRLWVRLRRAADGAAMAQLGFR